MSKRTSEYMSPVVEYSPDRVTKQDIAAIASGIGTLGSILVGLEHVDPDAGMGRIDVYCRCLWRKDGRRIEISVRPGSGGVLWRVSDDPDPAYPGQRVTITGIEEVN